MYSDYKSTLKGQRLQPCFGSGHEKDLRKASEENDLRTASEKKDLRQQGRPLKTRPLCFGVGVFSMFTGGRLCPCVERLVKPCRGKEDQSPLEDRFWGQGAGEARWKDDGTKSKVPKTARGDKKKSTTTLK